MKTRTGEVSAFQAKTHLSELLRETAAGKSFVIRRRGKAVAQLVPPPAEGPGSEMPKILAAFREIRKRIPGSVNVRHLIEAGRRR